MAKKMWAGRFEKATDKEVNDYNSSLPFDCKMYSQDIEGSIAHSQMLAKQGVISEKDAEDIKSGLLSIKEDIESGKLTFDSDAEDIHMFIEEELTNRIGDAGKRLHTGRSRNDQVALDQRLYMVDEAGEIIELMDELISVLVDIAKANTETYMPGYTHLQRAQPITYAHYLSAYIEMFKRDIDRLNAAKDRANVSPLGSGALAGTTYPLDREFVAEQLGMNGVTLCSLDGVADRDFAIEFASACSILMIKIPRSGFTYGRKIAALCEAFHRPMMIGSQSESALGAMAIIHMGCGLKTISYPCEFMDFDNPRASLINEKIDMHAGRVYPSDKPGLGVTLNEDAVAEYTVEL